MRRGIGILGRAAAYLMVFLVVAALDAVVATTSVRPDMVAVVGPLMWAVPIVAYYVAVLRWGVNPRSSWLMAAWLVSPLLMMAVALGAWTLVLHQRGEPAVATVVEVHGSDRGATTYTLAHNGVRIPGRLTTWPGNDAVFTENAHGALGDRVNVVHDPEGLVDPRLPEEVTEAAEMVIVTIPLTVAIVAGLCVGAAWPAARR